MFSSGLHNRCEEWKVWTLKPYVNSTSWMAVVAATDRPKSACNPCVIECFCSVFASLSLCTVSLCVLFLCLSYECVGYLPVSLILSFLFDDFRIYKTSN